MINETIFNQVVANAMAKAGDDKKWQNAITRAAKEILSGEMIVTVLAHGALVTTANGTYASSGACSCAAARHGHMQCAHRAAARLMDLYESEMVASATFTADVAASPRKNLIIEIENVWPKTWPPLYTELLARFGKSELNMLDDDSLRRVRLAIAL